MGLVVVVATNAKWGVDFFHVVGGAFWTALDLFLGFVLGPILGRLSIPARVELTTRLMPKMLLIMPTVVVCTLVAGWQLAHQTGDILTSYPHHGWVVASMCVVAVMAVVALGLLEPANVAVLFELKKPQPDGEIIGRLMKRFIYSAVVGIGRPVGAVIDEVVARLLERYEAGLPLLPGAVDAVVRLGGRWPLGLASSSNRVVIDRVLELAGMQQLFVVTVSSEEVGRGKPAPDVYLEASRRMGVPTERAAAIEDSANGIRAARAAGLTVIAVPNRQFPPPPDALDMAELVLDGLYGLTVATLDQLPGSLPAGTEQRIDEQEEESFPASDPHSDWAGPPS